MTDQNTSELFAGTMPVSEKHGFDTKKLNDYLAEHLENFSGPVTVEEFKGGQSNPTYLIKTSTDSYVLRRKPPGLLLKSAHAVDREYKVIKALNMTDVPVPIAYLHCEDESVIGTEFFLMSFVEGTVFWEPHIPEAKDNKQRSDIYKSLSETIYKLHNVNPSDISLEDYGRPGNYVARQVSRWSKQYVASETETIEAMNNLMEWLPENLPTEKPLCLVHGDFSLTNVIIDNESDQVASILDWELSTLGDPMADFSYHCLQYKLNPILSDAAQCKNLGIPTEKEYLKLYADKVDYYIDSEWDLYMSFNLFKLAGISQGIMGRVRDGTAAGVNAEETGMRARLLAESAWDLVKDRT